MQSGTSGQGCLALFDPSHIDFTVLAALLATQPAFLADRFGAYSKIVDTRIGQKNDSRFLSLDNPSMVPRLSRSS
jgi:hypothetical protein